VGAAIAGLIGGLALLLVGAELLVGAAARVAVALGIPPLIVGLTVVAFGTSAPELAVSLRAALDSSAELAVGNVVGSNIFNVLFILGVSALVAPLAVPPQLVRLDVPVMIGVALLAYVWSVDGTLGSGEGALLVAGLIAYVLVLVRFARVDGTAGPAIERGTARAGRDALLLVAGLLLLTAGARLLVDGAVAVATALGVGQAVIGVTIVAAGTSLPEVATSVLAARRGQREIALGNIVGSNIFNVLSVLGLSALLAPAGVPVSKELLSTSFPVMLGVSAALLPVCASRSSIARWEGIVFFVGYVGFTGYTVAVAVAHPTVPLLDRLILWVILPVALVGLIVDVAVRHRRRRAQFNGR
jgi:cation:H+ antiporter